ncbi:MAG: hypothetical protein FYV88_4920, partial [Bacteroidetes bacterium]|nr:hypothetical protein [Bacteroidota bacterium]
GVVEMIQSAGIVVSAGHSNATYHEAVAAFDRGIPVATYLFRKKRWEMSVVFEVGYGVIYTDTLGLQQDWSLRSNSIKSIFPVGAGLSANLIIPDIRGLHFLTYLGLNGMVGIRKTQGSAGGGLYWSISSAIFIDRIFTDIKYGVRKK